MNTVSRCVILSIVLLSSQLAVAAPPEGAGRSGPGSRPGLQGRDERFGHGKLLEKLMQSEGMAKQLGLSKEQVTTIQDALFDIKTQEIDLRAKLEKAGIRQARILMADTVDEEALMQAVEAAGKVRTELAKLRIRPLMLMKRTLTPEQQEKAGELMRRQMRSRVHSMRHGSEDGPGRTRHPQSGSPRRRRPHQLGDEPEAPEAGGMVDAPF